MSITADEDGSVEAQGSPPRTIRFSDLSRQPLDQGKGSAREIWADPDDGLGWQLRVVEVKDSTGLLVGPAGTHHYVVGLAGPQVAVRSTGASRVLRREEILPVPSATVLFERPRLRPPGASSLIVLTYFGAVDPPGFLIQTIDAGAGLPLGAQVLVALRGTVRVGGAEAAQGSALLLDPAQSYRPGTSAAHLLIVHRSGADESDPGEALAS